MQFQNYEQLGDMVKKAQEPFQAIAELNLKTLQSFDYLKPEDLAHIKKPEEFLEKHLSVIVENGHKTLDYMQQSFQILEQAMHGIVRETQKESVVNVKKESVKK